MFKILATAGLAIGLGLTTTACTDGYGYSGVNVGYSSGGYGGYGNDYYPGYASNSSYFGWYGDYYYPGTGYYVYDRNRRPFRWNGDQQRYWQGRQQQYGQYQGRGGRAEYREDRREVRENWQNFRQDQRQDRREFVQDRRQDRQALQNGTLTREQFRNERRDDRQTYTREQRQDRRALRRENRRDVRN